MTTPTSSVTPEQLAEWRKDFEAPYIRQYPNTQEIAFQRLEGCYSYPLQPKWEGYVQAKTEQAAEIAQLKVQLAKLLRVLKEGRRAIGDHYVPDHCYATGPITGNDHRDLVECPACSFIAMYENTITKLPKE
jgi:hypothetical protein